MGGQPATRPPANALIEAEFSTVPFAPITAKLGAVPPNTTVVAKTTTMSSDAESSDALSPDPMLRDPVPPAAMSPNAIVAAAFVAAVPDAEISLDATGSIPRGPMVAYAAQDDTAMLVEQDQAGPSQARLSASADPVEAAKRELPYLKYYVYSELPPPEKPAKVALEAFSDTPLGTPIDEIRRAARAFGLDFNFMKAVAKIESDFHPWERTGSYIGLFQLSRSEFKRYGSGDITNPRDNAIAAANKFVVDAAMFEAVTNKKPTMSDLYLIHQQGWEGAAEHESHPNWLAWKSMCATDEGMEKGERWCKRAIWGNTLPAVKRKWRSVNRLTSAAFVAMWRNRIDDLYARYADAGGGQEAQAKE